MLGNLDLFRNLVQAVCDREGKATQGMIHKLPYFMYMYNCERHVYHCETRIYYSLHKYVFYMYILISDAPNGISNQYRSLSIIVSESVTCRFEWCISDIACIYIICPVDGNIFKHILSVCETWRISSPKTIVRITKTHLLLQAVIEIVWVAVVLASFNTENCKFKQRGNWKTECYCLIIIMWHHFHFGFVIQTCQFV